MLNDTIAAVSTANGEGAVSMIRISGEDTFEIFSKIFDHDLSDAKGYTVRYGMIVENGEPVDEVLVNVYRAPHSYTGEDVLEVMCHGGIYITRKILRLIYASGARPAERGEFTQRAYLNGKMDLSQAEGVNDLIRARDEVNARSALHSLKGSVKKILEPLTEELVQIISNIEVNIDYPEYDDVHQLTDEEILPASKKWLEEIRRLIRTAEESVKIRSGIDTVILGKPNVGKSSLLNALLEEDKAIVTDIAGTTRDIVEGTVRVGDITLNLIDTAGIHESEDRIEQMGIERSLKALDKAQLVIMVLDSTTGITEEDRKLLELSEGKTRIVVYNKNDQVRTEDTLSISAQNRELDDLRKAIEETYEKELISAGTDTLNNDRQIALAMQAENAMKDAITALEDGVELDLVTIDLQKAYDELKEITGESTREDLLDQIFSRFCLGK